MVKIIKRKRLNEDDTTNTLTPALLQTVLTQPALQPQQLTATLPQALQPVAQQPALLLQAPAQQLQQPLQLLQPQQLNADPNVLNTVSELLKQMENTYWCIANNIPEMIKQKLNDFTPENATAKPIIDLWDAFKKDPSENTFANFIDKFKNYGAVDNNTQQPSVQQTDNNQQTIPTNNVSASIVYNFANALTENLNKANHNKNISEILKNY